MRDTRAVRSAAAVVAVAVIAGLVVSNVPVVHAAVGEITTFAGGPGSGEATNLALPTQFLAADEATVFLADGWTGDRRATANVVHAVDVATGDTSVLAGTGGRGDAGDGGPAAQAQLTSPAGVAVDDDGNLYIADLGNHRVRKVDAETGVITTIAGDGTFGSSDDRGDLGPATEAQVEPIDVDVDSSGNVYIAEPNHNRIRRVEALTGLITTVAGGGQGAPGDGDNGPAIQAVLNGPQGVAVDDSGNIFIADTFSDRVRRVDGVTQVISTYAGGGADPGDTPGPATDAQLSRPLGLALNAAGGLHIADSGNDRVRLVSPGGVTAGPTITTVVGDVPGDLLKPTDVAVSASGSVYIADYEANVVYQVARVTAGPPIVTFAGNGWTSYGGDGGPAVAAQFGGPRAVAFAPEGALHAGSVYVAESDFLAHALVRRIDPSGLITTVAGTPGVAVHGGDGGPASSSSLAGIAALAVDAAGNVYIADGISRVRRIDTAGIITTVAGTEFRGFSGDGGPAELAQLDSPFGLAVDAAGNLFISDLFNHSVRRVDAATNVITTYVRNEVGDGSVPNSPELVSPRGLRFDDDGNLFIAATGSNRVLRFDASTNVITIVAGNGDPSGGASGFNLDAPGGEGPTFGLLALGLGAAGLIMAIGDDGPATDSPLSPTDVAMDGAGNLYIADEFSVRRVDAATGEITTIAGTGLAGFSGDGADAASARLGRVEGLAIGPDGHLYIADAANSRIRLVELPPLPPPPPPVTDADLSVTLERISSADPTVGSPTTLEIVATNAGPANATNAVVTHDLPAGWTLDGVSTSQGTCDLSASTITCLLGPLAVGQKAIVNPQVTPNQAGSSTHSAGVAADQPDPALGDNVAGLAVLVAETSPSPSPSPVATPSTSPSPPVASPSAPPGATSPPPAPAAPGITPPPGGTPLPTAGSTLPPASRPTGGPRTAVLSSGSGPSRTTADAASGLTDRDGGSVVRPAPATPPPATPPPAEPAPTASEPAGAPLPPAPAPAPESQPTSEGPITFARSVPLLEQLGFNPTVLLQSAVLAAAVLLLLAFPSQLFNATVEKHQYEIRGWFAPVARGMERFGAAVGAFWSSPIGVASFLLLSGLLYALLDPGFGISVDGLATLIGMTAGLLVVTVVFGLPLLLASRRSGVWPSAKALPGTLLVGAACVLVSKLADLQPGYMYGLIIGFAVARELGETEERRFSAIASALMLIVSVLAWLALGALRAGGGEGIVATMAETALAATFVAGLEQVVFGLLPMRFMPGAGVYAWNRIVWASLMGLSLFAFIHILVNPASGYLTDTRRTPVFVTVALVAAFGLFSLGFWAYFRFRPMRPLVSSTDPGEVR